MMTTMEQKSKNNEELSVIELVGKLLKKVKFPKVMAKKSTTPKQKERESSQDQPESYPNGLTVKSSLSEVQNLRNAISDIWWKKYLKFPKVYVNPFIMGLDKQNNSSQFSVCIKVDEYGRQADFLVPRDVKLEELERILSYAERAIRRGN